MTIPACQSFPSLPGYRLLHYPELDSTNLEVARFIKTGNDAHGLVIWADHQTAGRGRLSGRNWVSPPGKGLTFSLAVRRHREDWEGRLPGFPLLVGVALLAALDQAVADGLSRRDERMLLKWPNDVYLDDKKLSGILIESEGEMSIVGIGMNINIDKADFKAAKLPKKVRQRVTSLKIVTGREWDCLTILKEFLSQLQTRLDRWQENPSQEWTRTLESYRRRFYLQGKNAEYSMVGETPVKVQVLGLADDGGLRVIFPDGHEETLLAGDVMPR